jgi:16S rRNA (uracil1498-N3)-methyltransferase
MPTLPRLFSVEPLTATGAIAWLDPHESHHGRHVLRLRDGDRVAVFDNTGAQFAATVERFENKRLAVVLAEPVPGAPETPVPITLYLALTKGETFDAVLQRAVELGVSEIIPFIAERSFSAIGKRAVLGRKMERWRQILLSATKQCGRARLTFIATPLPFNGALERPTPDTISLCSVPNPEAPLLSEKLRSLNRASVQSLAVMIGPEGGLTPDEIAACRRNWHLVSLGPRILRVETAAAAALTLILGFLGEV